jgi:arylsulfatase A-like enzyme
VRRLAALVSPSPLALGLALGLASVQSFIAGRAGVFTGPADGVGAWAYLAALWIVGLALLAALARAIAALPLVLRVLACAVVGAAAAAAIAFDLVSWAYRFASGTFAGHDAVAFFARDGALADFGHTAPIGYAGVVVLALVGGAALALVLPRLGRDGWGDVPASAGTVRLGVLALLLVAIALGARTRGTRVDPALAYALEPAPADGAGPPIRPVLARRDLVPLVAAPGVPPPPSPPPTRPVVLIAIESLRPDIIGLEYQGQLVMPRFTELARDGHIFGRVWATSTQSNYADPSIPSGLYPLRSRDYFRYRPGDRHPRTMIWDVLKPAGYATAFVSSQNEHMGGVDAFLATPGLDVLYHPDVSEERSHVSKRDTGIVRAIQSGELRAGWFDDAHTVAYAIDWMRKQKGRPFFVAVTLQASHFPYLLPDAWQAPFAPKELPADVQFVHPDPAKIPIARVVYANALRYVDEQLGKLLDALQADGLFDEALIAVVGENGESFAEGGSAMHGAEPVEAAIRVSFVLHAPGLVDPVPDAYPVSGADVTPTILGRLGFPKHPGFQGIDVLADDRPLEAERLLFAHVNTPLARANVAVLGGQWKYVYDERTYTERLSDVVEDPRDERNVIGDHPEIASRLRSAVDEWKARQLAYYAFPFYFLSYWPPAPRVELPSG